MTPARIAFCVVLQLLFGWIPTVASAQSWWSGPERGGCFGGRECDRRGYLEVRLEDAPVLSIRFSAHDGVGPRQDGRLRIRIDDTVLERDLSLERYNRSFTVDGDRRRGRYLIFEALTDDEVSVEDIEIEYADRDRRGAPPRTRASDRHSEDWQAAGGGWSRYRMRETCIGGSRCSDHRLEVRLLDEPVLAVRFFAHDNVGQRRKGRLRVTLDHDVLASGLNVEKHGRTYTLDARGQYARFLVIEPDSDDEVVVESLEVEYSGTRQPPRQSQPPLRRREFRSLPYDAKHCIGGRECGHQYTLEVRLDGQPIEGIRFFAHSGVSGGYRARLRVLIDRKVVGDDLSIPRSGDFFEIAPDEPSEGSRYLVFEAIGADEVVIEDIEINYRGSWVRHRVEDRDER